LALFTSIPTHTKHPPNLFVYLYIFSIVPLLVIIIVPGVQLYSATDLASIARDLTILRFAQCYLIVFVAIQIPILIFILILYFRHRDRPIATDEVLIRAGVIFGVASLLVWIQAIKVRQSFYTPGPQTAVKPPWFLQRPIVYAGIFMPELICVVIYATTNIRTRHQRPVRHRKQVQELGSTPIEKAITSMGEATISAPRVENV
jgi:hypothetical protein